MIATQITGWRDVCDTVVDEVLRETGSDAVPVDSLKVAAALGIEVVLDCTLLRRTRFQRNAKQQKLRVKPDGSSESLQWAVAHELGEHLTPRVCDLLSRSSGENHSHIGGFLKEQIANEIAGRILLPRQSFLESIDRTSGDLLELKEQFSTASYELILLGLLRWPENSIVTLFDSHATTRRFGNRGSVPKMSPLEFDVWNECHRTGRTVVADVDGQRVQAWAMHQGEQDREYLRTTESEHQRVVQAQLFELAG